MAHPLGLNTGWFPLLLNPNPKTSWWWFFPNFVDVNQARALYLYLLSISLHWEPITVENWRKVSCNQTLSQFGSLTFMKPASHSTTSRVLCVSSTSTYGRWMQEEIQSMNQSFILLAGNVFLGVFVLCSSDAKIRSEVIAPFRSFRMFFYGAFIASGSIGGLIAVTRLIGALNHAPGAEAPIEIAKGLGIDLAAVIIFALLYQSDAKAREIALAKLSREEDLANLRLQLDNKKVVTLAQLRGISRIVILAGPGSYIEEALKQSEPFKAALLERGVLLAPYATDGATLTVDSPAVATIAGTSIHHFY